MWLNIYQIYYIVLQFFIIDLLSISLHNKLIILFLLFQLTPVGTTIFQDVHAEDDDAGVNGLVEYFVVPGKDLDLEEGDKTVADGFGYFSINLPHQGQVTVNRSLDYERTQRYLVTIVASVSFNSVVLFLIFH